MSLAPGTRIGSYEILGSLGAGGMGEVYRARDSRLQRDVAIKVLPDAVAQDADRRARFEREARTLASLNHPRIATVHGVEDAGDTYAMVMELVEGPTLATMVAHGPLPIPEALALAGQIADALEAAHEQGVIHRDLKPANIKVRPDGTVKVLDFGLAKALSPASGDSALELANSPTMMATGRTEAGIILGTAAYMSPEQARGRPVDKRADIWAFGCVLYEMLIGRQAFSGESTTDVLASVVQREPDWSLLPANLPAGVHALLRRALQKNARERLRDIGDARLELAATATSESGISTASPAMAPAVAAVRPRSRAAGIVLACLATGALGAAAAWQWRPASVPAESGPATPIRSSITLPPSMSVSLGRGSSVALSPDGGRLVYVGNVDGTIRLYLRPLDRFESIPLAGTEGASNPFFSLDGRWIGFFAESKLKKVSLDGGAPVALSDVRIPRGEAWLPDGSILVTPMNNAALSQVPALGGPAQPFSELATGEMSHRWPRAIPGGSAVLFSLWNDTGWEPSRIAVQRTGERGHRVLIEGGGYARAVVDPATGRSYLIYARAEGLLAAPFDATALVVTGPPTPMVDSVITNLSGAAHFDVAGNTLAYIPGTIGETDRDLVWVTLDGRATDARRVQRMSQDFSLSPDGTRILRNNTVGTRDVWIEDLARGTSTRVTNSSESFGAAWSHDAQWIVFARGAPIRSLYRRRLTAGALDEPLTTSPNWQEPFAITRDGSRVVYVELDRTSSSDIWVLDLPPAGAAPIGPGDPRARPFVKTNFAETQPTLSPDGQWLAYQSNDSGRFEVYARPFPDGGPAHQISTAGGVSPVWAADGTLFYRSLSGRMMAVRGQSPAAFGPETTRPLFDAGPYENFYGAAPDGKRLLMMKRVDLEQRPTVISLVQNFVAELRQRVK
jgi:serine/threonine protein kinase/Tol biopolymer transport system component